MFNSFCEIILEYIAIVILVKSILLWTIRVNIELFDIVYPCARFPYMNAKSDVHIIKSHANCHSYFTIALAYDNWLRYTHLCWPLLALALCIRLFNKLHLSMWNVKCNHFVQFNIDRWSFFSKTNWTLSNILSICCIAYSEYLIGIVYYPYVCCVID